MKLVILLLFSFSVIACDNKGSGISGAGMNDDHQQETLHGSRMEFIERWESDGGRSFMKLKDLTYSEALSFAAFIDVNVRTQGLGAWAAGLGTRPPEDGGTGEYPAGKRLEKLQSLRFSAYKKIKLPELNVYFESWDKLKPLFDSDPSAAHTKESVIEKKYLKDSSELLYPLYVSVLN